jgi:DNA-binding transcriptional LysR family regulator
MQSLRRTLGNANALVVFEAAARHASFTRAAEELGISQPAVTRQIKAVEDSVGCALFARRHNRLTLTAEGLRLWTSVTGGLGEIASTLEAMRKEDRRGRLVLASHAGFAQQWLMPRFAALCALLDRFDVRLLISDSDSELDRGDFDFAVRVGGGDWPGHGSHLLIAETVCPVASPGFLECHPELRNPRPEDLLDAPLLHMDEGDKAWMTWSGWFRAQGVDAAPPRPEVLYNNYPLVLQEALAGKGVALGWRPLTDLPVSQGALVVIGPEAVSRRTGYFLTWPEREPGLALIERLRNWFDREFSGGGA